MFGPLSLREFWKRVFVNRKRSFETCFMHDGHTTTSGRNVLAYLAKFCYAADHLDTPDKTPLGPFMGDASILEGTDLLLIREGRRQVFREIQTYLNLTEGDIKQLVEDLPDEE